MFLGCPDRAAAFVVDAGTAFVVVAVCGAPITDLIFVLVRLSAFSYLLLLLLLLLFLLFSFLFLPEVPVGQRRQCVYIELSSLLWCVPRRVAPFWIDRGGIVLISRRGLCVGSGRRRPIPVYLEFSSALLAPHKGRPWTRQWEALGVVNVIIVDNGWRGCTVIQIGLSTQA